MNDTPRKVELAIGAAVLISIGVYVFLSRVTSGRVVIDWGSAHREIGVGIAMLGVYFLTKIFPTLTLRWQAWVCIAIGAIACTHWSAR
jgi:hypothetical protein